MTVSIDTYTPQVLPKVSLDIQQDSKIPVDPEVARVRAFKAAWGLQDVAPKQEDDIHTQLVSGYENIMRSSVATEVDKNMAEQSMASLAKMSADPEVSSDQLAAAIANIDVNRKTDPRTIFEQAFANAAVNQVDDKLRDAIQPDQTISLQQAFKYVKPGTSDLIAKQQYLRKWAQDIQDEVVNNQSYLGYGADFLKTMFQPYAEYKQRGNVSGVGFFQGPLGYNLKTQGQTVLRQPMNAMIDTLKPHIDQLKKDNPQLAVQYLNSLAGMTSEDQVVNNLFTFMMPFDLATIAYGSAKVAGGISKTETTSLMTGKPTAVTAKVTSKGVQYTADELEGLGVAQSKAINTAKDIVKATSEEPVTPSSLASAVGDVKESGIKKAAEITDMNLKGDLLDPNQELRAGSDLLSSNYRIDRENLSNNVGSRGSDIANRVLIAHDRHADSAMEGILGRTLVNKTPGFFQSEVAMRAAAADIIERQEYKGLSSSISDVEFKHDIASNTLSYNIVLRQPDGQPFFSEAEARAWLKMNFPKFSQKDITVVPEGVMGYKAVLNAPLKTSDPIMQKLLIPTGHEKDPEGILSSWIGWAVNPDETLSEAHREARKIAAYGPAWLMSHMKEDAKILTSFARGATQVNPLTGKIEKFKLSGMRQRTQDWSRMIKAMRTMPDPDNPGYLGAWHKGVGDMEDYYWWHYNRLPEEAEVQAYFAYKRINEYDRILRDLRYYGNMWTEGVQNQKFSFKDAEGVKDLTFKGHRMDTMPSGGTGGSVLYIGDKSDPKTWKVYKTGRVPPALNKKWEKGLAEGTHNSYRVWNPDEHEFFGFGPVTEDHWIRYVMIKGGAESSNIPFNLLPRRGGGHWDVDHPFYMSQVKIYLDGDTAVASGTRTIMPVQIRAEGQKVAGHINEIRKLLKAGANDPETLAYYNAHANEIGVPYNKLISWFNPMKDEQGRKIKPMLNLDHDIVIRPKDTEITDIDKTIERYYTDKGIKFVDGTKTGNPARQAQVQYTGMRDSDELFTLKDKGTRYNPLFEYETATMADPIETMNRALTKITQSTYLEDYRQYSVSNWLKKASNWMEEPDKDIAGAPYHYFYDPKWKKNTPETVKRNLMNENNNIRQFLGMSNPTDRLVQETTQKMVDQIYGKYGPNAVKLIPDWMMYGIADPIAFIKKVTYHSALGLFSIPQFIVQMMTYPLIAALSPRSVVSGIYANMLHNWATINPKMLSTLDGYATKLKIPGFHAWKTGEFEEAHKLGLRSGFFDVQGEHAFIDSIMDGNKLVSGLGRQFLDWGTMPFKAGERQVRLGAWYTAYKEFRVANPTGRITQADYAKILNRADDLYGNMSRASSSQLHTGVLSIPTQFLSYQLRISELFLGSRTSYADKARMVATFAALFGAPMAVGLSGLPLGDYLKRKAIDEGYNVGDNFITSMIMEGIPSYFVAMATGGGDAKKGNFYDFGSRYAANGMDMFRGDKNMWDIVGGPAYSKAKGVLESMSPFWQAMMSLFRDDDQYFPLTAQDYLRPFKEISSVNNVANTLAALNTGRVFTKKGIYVEPTSPANAIFMGLTGVKSTQSADAQRMSITLKERKQFEDDQVKEFENKFKQGLRLAANGQPEEAKDYFKQAFVYLWRSGAREDELTGILARASEDNQSLVEQIEWSYYIKNAPDYSKAQMYEAFSKRLQARSQ